MFKLVAPYKPAGDQPKVIEQLVKGIKAGMKHQVLLGVTGSGKTFVIANVINAVQKPTLIISHNKTLAAQLAAEFRDFFPNNAVCYFVSYYDYYQPEAYVPQQDMYIEKDVDINEEIEKYRNSATQAVLTRRDVIVVATVSCIYGLGNPEDYLALSRTIRVGDIYRREKLLLHLINLQYARTKSSISPRQFRVRGDTFEIFQPSGDVIVRIEFFGDEVERIELIDYVTGEVVDTPATITIFPATHYVAPEERLQTAIEKIQEELKDRVRWFEKKGKIVEAQRLKQRTEFDLEMIKECGYCKGIENYSRCIDGRLPGTHPSTLLDYFPDDYLLIIDESHITIPQIRGMYNGDLSRKKTLVDYGFRLPSALDNRPLKFKEFERYINQAIYMSATPAEWEINQAQRCLKEVPKIKGYPTNGVVELLVRPTGLLDPIVEVRPTKGQIKDLIEEIKKRVRKKQRVLVTTMTKKMAEDLTEYLNNRGIKVQYLHSDVETIERTEILLNLREGKYDVVVGINLLREGLDLPEVSLVAILDADKEGFLRSDTSLIQIMGRAARHVEGKVIMYADEITESMQRALDEAKRRRRIQEKYNKIHNIVPKSIKKEIKSQLERSYEKEREKRIKVSRDVEIENGILFVKERPIEFGSLDRSTLRRLIHVLEDKMEIAAKNLEFEKAAVIRDKIYALKRSL